MNVPGGHDPVKVLFVSSGFNLPGGISNLSGSVLRGLDDLGSDGNLARVDVVSLHDRKAPVRPNHSGKTFVARGNKARLVISILRLVALRRPDLLLFDHVGPARAVRTMPRRMRPTYAVMVHGLEIEQPTRPSTSAVLSGATMILANSHHTAKRAIDLAGPDVIPRIEIVNPCISRERTEMWSADGPSSKRDSQVVIVGRLETGQPGKGHEALIEAWPHVVAAIPSAKLVIAGDGNKRAALEQMVADNAMSHNVDFEGHVSPERLGELYRQSALYAMPSSQEGFGIVFAEAMWHGLPCIGSDADAASEVLVDGETGILVSYGDADATARAVLRLLTDQELAAAMGRAGRARCLDLFTIDALKARLRSIIASVTGS